MGKSLATRIIQILFLALFGLSILLTVIFAINQKGDVLLIYTYVLFAIALGAALLFAVINMFKSKKSLISSLIVMGIFGVLVLVSYALASGSIPQFIGVETFDVTASISRWIGTSLYMLYIMLGAAFVGLIFSEIRGAIK